MIKVSIIYLRYIYIYAYYIYYVLHTRVHRLTDSSIYYLNLCQSVFLKWILVFSFANMICDLIN